MIYEIFLIYEFQACYTCRLLAGGKSYFQMSGVFGRNKKQWYVFPHILYSIGCDTSLLLFGIFLILLTVSRRISFFFRQTLQLWIWVVHMISFVLGLDRLFVNKMFPY